MSAVADRVLLVGYIYDPDAVEEWERAMSLLGEDREPLPYDQRPAWTHWEEPHPRTPGDWISYGRAPIEFIPEVEYGHEVFLGWPLFQRRRMN